MDLRSLASASYLQLFAASVSASPAPHPHHCDHCGTHHELVVKDLRVDYRALKALDQVNFGTRCGRRLALVGPNGAGKSTLLKAMAGLVPRRAGTVLWRGSRIKRWSRELAYLPQREEVDWEFPLTVRGLVEMGRYPQLGPWRRWRSEDQRIVDEALEALDLTDLDQRQIRELSGGQQQRAFLARAVAQQAHVLLLDEPFTGLDRRATDSLGQLLARLADEGRLVIASHHDLASVPTLFDEVLVLRTEQLAFGPVAQVWSEELLHQAFAVPA